MATIRKRGDKYHVQVRRSGQASVSKTFHELKDAKVWAHAMEVRADQGELRRDRKALNVTLGESMRWGKRDNITGQFCPCTLDQPYVCTEATIQAEQYGKYRDQTPNHFTLIGRLAYSSPY